MISQALGIPVEQHDDGSRPGMHDLDIVYDDVTRAAVEVTAAADAASIELWNLMNGAHRRWQVEGLKGGWMVSLDPLARANRLRNELPSLLMQLERLEIRQLRPRRHRDGPFDAVGRDLGIVHASQGDTDYPGSIYVTLSLLHERSGGFVSESGDALASWIGEFLRDQDQHDVLGKLSRSGAEDRHAFVFLPGFSVAPFSASDLLMRDDAPLPTASPQLPREVTHVWAVSTWTSGAGFRWSPSDGWTKFDKTVGTAVE